MFDDFEKRQCQKKTLGGLENGQVCLHIPYDCERVFVEITIERMK